MLGNSFSERIGTIVTSVIQESLKNNLEIISISDGIYSELSNLRTFLFDRVYRNPELEREREKVTNILRTIFDYVSKEPEKFINIYPESDTVKQRIIDFIAGMTDNYAIRLFKEITLI
jgi:dGTPase